MTYEQVEAIQRHFCKELNHEYIAAPADLKVGIALETLGRLPLNGLRHPLKGDTTGWYLWCGEEFPSGKDSFSPVHTHHLLEFLPEALKYLGPVSRMAR